jgi:hypothetical protein
MSRIQDLIAYYDQLSTVAESATADKGDKNQIDNCQILDEEEKRRYDAKFKGTFLVLARPARP